MTAIFSDQIMQKFCIDQSANKGKDFSYVSRRVESEIENLSDSDRNFLTTCLEYHANFVTLSELYGKSAKTVGKRYREILNGIKKRI